MDFGGAIQFFTDKVNNHLYIRFANSVDMSSWGEIATMDKVAHEVDTSYMSNGVLNILSIRQSLGAGCYEIMGQGNSAGFSIKGVSILSFSSFFKKASNSSTVSKFKVDLLAS